MSIKPLILSHQTTAAIRPETRYIFEKYFDVEEYQSDRQYDPASTLVVVPNWNAQPWCHKLYTQGFRMVIDNLWEIPNAWKKDQQYNSWDVNRVHVMHTPNWFWYYESTRLVYARFNHTFAPTYAHLALMPMRLRKNHRTNLYYAMKPWLHDCYWSYHGLKHHYLPGDIDINDWSSQRYVNTQWYENTCFSMVAESRCDTCENCTDYRHPWPFVTEKTFKPIQYQHPFMIYGQKGTLKFLHDLGFETFENIFDESYDSIDSSNVTSRDTDPKLKIIINNVENFTKGPRDALTQQKIQHNHAHFSNMALVESRFVQEIIDPILEFLA